MFEMAEMFQTGFHTPPPQTHVIEWISVVLGRLRRFNNQSDVWTAVFRLFTQIKRLMVTVHCIRESVLSLTTQRHESLLTAFLCFLKQEIGAIHIKGFVI